MRVLSLVRRTQLKKSGDYNLQQVLKTTALVCHPIFSVSYIHLLPLLEQKGHKSKKVFQHILRCNTTRRVYRLKFWFEGLKIHHLSITTCFFVFKCTLGPTSDAAWNNRSCWDNKNSNFKAPLRTRLGYKMMNGNPPHSKMLVKVIQPTTVTSWHLLLLKVSRLSS